MDKMKYLYNIRLIWVNLCIIKISYYWLEKVKKLKKMINGNPDSHLKNNDFVNLNVRE